jgi:hypothetical protein
MPSWLIPALAYAVSIASLVWVLHGVDLGTMWDDITSMHWGWVCVAVVSDIAVYVYQGWRWNLLLNPVAPSAVWRSVQAIYVGLFANELLPFRPGELIRPYLKAHWSKLPFSVAFSSVLIERVFDGLWLVAVLLVTTRFLKLPQQAVDLAYLLGAATGVAAVALGIVMFGKHHAHAAVRNTRWASKLRVLVDDLHIIGRSPSFYAAALASLPYLLIQAVPVYALVQAYGLDLSIGSTLVVLIIWRLGTAIPQLPGNIGTSQAFLVLGLGLFGVDKTAASGLSFVTWGVITAPLVIAGSLALALTGGNLRDLHDRARAHAGGPVMATPTPGPK